MRHVDGDGEVDARVLVVVQNLPVPLDRRVWLECLALREAGYQVSVICPKGPGDASYQLLDGVHLYKYRPAPATRGLLSYLVEFVYCWLRTAWLSLRVRRRHGFDVLQACNPPDTYWLLARLWRPWGVRFVFDHHDLNPELFLSRFGRPRGLGGRAQLAALRWLERRTFRAADQVISTNESYRAVALDRGGLPPERTAVVRSGPDTAVMRPLAPLPQLRQGARYLLAYLGIMGPQDGIDTLLRAMRELVYERGRDDVHLALLGFGDMFEPMRELAVELGLARHVTFTGRADKRMIAEYLSTAVVGLCPDAKTPLNDVSTHNKVMEYMAHALPVVTFDLAETRATADDCAVYVPSGDLVAFVDEVDALLADTERRVELSRRSRVRCVAHLDWYPQARTYVGVYDRLTGRQHSGASPAHEASAADAGTVQQVDVRSVAAGAPTLYGHPAIDLRDPQAYEHFLRTRESIADDAARPDVSGRGVPVPTPPEGTGS